MPTNPKPKPVMYGLRGRRLQGWMADLSDGKYKLVLFPSRDEAERFLIQLAFSDATVKDDYDVVPEDEAEFNGQREWLEKAWK